MNVNLLKALVPSLEHMPFSEAMAFLSTCVEAHNAGVSMDSVLEDMLVGRVLARKRLPEIDKEISILSSYFGDGSYDNFLSNDQKTDILRKCKNYANSQGRAMVMKRSAYCDTTTTINL